MFHVATLLPYFPSDEQQLERKRHLGNDAVMLIYKEGSQRFDPSCIFSDFVHMFIVVSKVDWEEVPLHLRNSSNPSDTFFRFFFFIFLIYIFYLFILFYFIFKFIF